MVKGQEHIIRPEFNQTIIIVFLGAKITSDVCFLLLREMKDIEDPRYPVHIKHSLFR